MPHTDFCKIPTTIQKLHANQLIRHTDPKNLPKTTDLAQRFDKSFGQMRAINAIDTALDIHQKGYHVFAVGENGLGKRTLVHKLLNERAKDEPTPDDLIYLHNFENPRCPIACFLPNQTAPVFAQDMQKLWQTAHKKLTQKFASKSYQNALAVIKKNASLHEKKRINELNKEASKHNFVLNANFLYHDDHEAFGVLDPKKSTDNTALVHLNARLIELQFALDELECTANTQIDELHQTLADNTLQRIFGSLLKKYSQPDIQLFLKKALDDMVNNAIDIVDDEQYSALVVPSRYSINVLVSHQKQGAPIIFEEMPTHLNLLGHIEYITETGSNYSDVSMIRAGALHRANGGYLLLEASSLLEHPYAWQGIKRALQSSEIKISSLEQMLTLTGSLSLEPMGVPLSVKVILFGEPELYYELLEFEPEFNFVFKIRADFHHNIDRTTQNECMLAYKIADIVKSSNLVAFDNTACALIIDTLACFCEHQDKLDLHTDRLAQLVFETDRLARKDGSPIATSHHVKLALSAKKERTGYLSQLYWQELQNGQQMIATQGFTIGQINALTVISYADSEFGMPARLTALLQPKFGLGDILDIERDVELGGSLHAKGMLIMTSYLRSLFSEMHSLNFSASLVFEQSYGEIDGDSATLAEICALLSALALTPIYQGFAITGSMNQFGQVQAVGGINAKIEGFFKVCHEQGLTGKQGVIIPCANIQNLMLSPQIIDAVQNQKFHLYAINHVNEALALLTGCDIDRKNSKGKYQKDTLFGKISKRLKSWSNKDE